MNYVSYFFVGVSHLTGDAIELLIENEVVCIYLLADFELLFSSSSNMEKRLLPGLQGFLE